MCRRDIAAQAMAEAVGEERERVLRDAASLGLTPKEFSDLATVVTPGDPNAQ
jgi:hypothetical protein